MAITGFPIMGGSSGGSGGSVGNRYAGEWDMTQPTQTVNAEPDVSLSTTFSKVDDYQFVFIGDSNPIVVLGIAYDVVTTNGSSAKDSGVRSFKFVWPDLQAGDNLKKIYGIITATGCTPDDVMLLLLNSNPINVVNAVVAFIELNAANDGDDYIFLVTIQNNNATNYEYYPITGGLDASDTVFVDFDTATGGLVVTCPLASYVAATGLDLTVLDANTRFTPSVAVSNSDNAQLLLINPNSLLFDLGATDNGRLPFLSLKSLPLQSPANSVDGQVYKVIGDGQYLTNPPNVVGDYVEFLSNKTVLLTTRPSLTALEINDLITDASTETSETIIVASYASYDVDPDVDICILQMNGFVTGSTVRLPNPAYVYNGKRILVIFRISGAGSTGITIGNAVGTAAIESAIITSSIVNKMVFEFVANKPAVGTPTWVRVK